MAKHFVRWFFFFLILTFPLWNGFRMDIDNEKLFLLGYQLSYEASYLFFIFLLLFLMGFLSLAMIVYRAFCQYACPHNTFSMLLNKLEGKMGKAGKGLTFLLSVVVSAFMAYSTVSYFYHPVTIMNSIIGITLNKYFFLVGGLGVIYTALTYKARSSFCKVCPYGIAQGISPVDETAKWFTHPGVWISWGTTTILILVMLVGWF